LQAQIPPLKAKIAEQESVIKAQEEQSLMQLRRIDELEDVVSECNEEIEKLKNENEELTNTLNETEATLQICRAERDGFKQDVKDGEERAVVLRSEIADLEAGCADLEDKDRRGQQAIQDVQKQIEASIDLIGFLKMQAELQKDEEKRLVQLVEVRDEELKEALEEGTELEGLIPPLERRVTQLTRENREAGDENLLLSTERDKLKLLVEGIREREAMCQAEIESTRLVTYDLQVTIQKETELSGLILQDSLLWKEEFDMASSRLAKSSLELQKAASARDPNPKPNPNPNPNWKAASARDFALAKLQAYEAASGIQQYTQACMEVEDFRVRLRSANFYLRDQQVMIVNRDEDLASITKKYQKVR